MFRYKLRYTAYCGNVTQTIVVFMVPGASEGSQLITPMSKSQSTSDSAVVVVVVDLRFTSPCMCVCVDVDGASVYPWPRRCRTARWLM